MMFARKRCVIFQLVAARLLYHTSRRNSTVLINVSAMRSSAAIMNASSSIDIIYHLSLTPPSTRFGLLLAALHLPRRSNLTVVPPAA
jgi:hypothetical protein